MKTTSGLTWSAMPTNASPSSAVALRDGCGIGVAATAAAGWGDTIEPSALVCFGRLSVDANASPNTNAIATRVPNFSQSRVRTDIPVTSLVWGDLRKRLFFIVAVPDLLV